MVTNSIRFQLFVPAVSKYSDLGKLSVTVWLNGLPSVSIEYHTARTDIATQGTDTASFYGTSELGRQISAGTEGKASLSRNR